MEWSPKVDILKKLFLQNIHGPNIAEYEQNRLFESYRVYKILFKNSFSCPKENIFFYLISMLYLCIENCIIANTSYFSMRRSENKYNKLSGSNLDCM